MAEPAQKKPEQDGNEFMPLIDDAIEQATGELDENSKQKLNQAIKNIIKEEAKNDTGEMIEKAEDIFEDEDEPIWDEQIPTNQTAANDEDLPAPIPPEANDGEPTEGTAPTNTNINNPELDNAKNATNNFATEETQENEEPPVEGSKPETPPPPREGEVPQEEEAGQEQPEEAEENTEENPNEEEPQEETQGEEETQNKPEGINPKENQENNEDNAQANLPKNIRAEIDNSGSEEQKAKRLKINIQQKKRQLAVDRIDIERKKLEEKLKELKKKEKQFRPNGPRFASLTLSAIQDLSVFLDGGLILSAILGILTAMVKIYVFFAQGAAVQIWIRKKKIKAFILSTIANAIPYLNWIPWTSGFDTKTNFDLSVEHRKIKEEIKDIEQKLKKINSSVKKIQFKMKATKSTASR